MKGEIWGLGSVGVGSTHIYLLKACCTTWLDTHLQLPCPVGYRHWHADLRPDDSPLEAGLTFTCKLKTSVPFLGREALEKQRATGLRRRLVCLTVEE